MNPMEPLQPFLVSKRPVVVYGWGAKDEAVETAKRLGIPCASGIESLASNFAVRRADWVLCAGMGIDPESEVFSEDAKIFMFDTDAQASLREFRSWVLSYPQIADSPLPDFSDWKKECSL